MTINDLLNDAGCDRILRVLGPFLTEDRKTRIEEVLAARLQSVQVAVESPADPHNAVAVIRSAEAFGLTHIHLIGLPVRRRKNGRGIKRGTDRWTDLHVHENTSTFLETTGNSPVLLAGAVVGGGMPLDQLPVDRPLCLMFGNEHEGLSDEAIAACDLKFTIPMVGMVESFNISVAAGISCYEVARRRREHLSLPGDLCEAELQRLRALYYLRTIGPRKAEALLKRDLISVS